MATVRDRGEKRETQRLRFGCVVLWYSSACTPTLQPLTPPRPPPHQVEFPQGEEIITQGDPDGSTFYILRAGSIAFEVKGKQVKTADEPGGTRGERERERERER